MNNYGELVQTDLAQMYSYDNFQYFILLVDAFSSKVFVRPLKTKTSLAVSLALNYIFNEFGAKIYKLESDRGKCLFPISLLHFLFCDKLIINLSLDKT